MSFAQDFPGAWAGDTDIFQYDQGLLHYRNDGKSGQASITLKYETPRDGYLIWDFGTRFSTPPTSQNRFSLTLFAIQEDDNLSKYVLEPSPTGKEILLLEKTLQKSGSDWKEISQKTLDSHSLRFATTAWDGLDIRIIYEDGIGLLMQSFTPHGDLNTSEEIISLKSGTPIWEMELRTQFTSKKKLDHSYLLPKVTDRAEDTDESPLKIVESKVDELGEVYLKVNKPVDTSEAVVTCKGHHPSISSGTSPDILIIQLGKAFQANTEYHFVVTNLLNLQGGKESLEFTVMGKSDSESSIEIPRGIFITEVMVDPPTSGNLKDSKYIELYNNSGEDIDLAGLVLVYRKTKFQLPHHKWVNQSFAIIYPEADPYPTNLALLVPMTSFPPLSGSFILSIHDLDGNVLDQINFSSRLYGEGFTQGLASLERVGYHPDRWRRSNHPNGGTPGLHTNMIPHADVEEHTIVINELMLSPSGTSEKYIELYNRSSDPIDISNLYLTYANKEEAKSSKSWLPVNETTILNPGQYLVLCPFPESLARIFPNHDSNTFVERIDFPAISSTYSEIELRSQSDHRLIDKVVYRRQWLGDKTRDRTGYSLERISPDRDGTHRNNWRRAKSIDSNSKIGGTPGVRNSVFGIGSDDSMDDDNYHGWPENPEIKDIKELYNMLQSYSDLAELEVYTLDGVPIYSAKGSSIYELLNKISKGQTPYPTMLMVVRVTFTDEEKDPSIVSYVSVWLHQYMK